MSLPARADITGLVLAGGRGSRMGGADKGLQAMAGAGSPPLALNALRRLAPQVGRLLVSANRHLDAYRAFGAAVIGDHSDDADGGIAFDGPLAGLHAALGRCETPWLAAVPCDAPRFPRDLVEKLAAVAHASGAPLAIACTRRPCDAALRPHPVFCLLHADLRGSLRDCLDAGQRAVLRWAESQGAARAVFDDDDAFFNANTPSDLAPSTSHAA